MTWAEEVDDVTPPRARIDVHVCELGAGPTTAVGAKAA